MTENFAPNSIFAKGNKCHKNTCCAKKDVYFIGYPPLLNKLKETFLLKMIGVLTIRQTEQVREERNFRSFAAMHYVSKS